MISVSSQLNKNIQIWDLASNNSSHPNQQGVFFNLSDLSSIGNAEITTI